MSIGLCLPLGVFPLVFPTNSPYVPHAPPIQFFLILSPNYYLMNSTNQDVQMWQSPQPRVNSRTQTTTQKRAGLCVLTATLLQDVSQAVATDGQQVSSYSGSLSARSLTHQYPKTAVSAPTNLHVNKHHPTVLICFIIIFCVQNQLQSRPLNCSFANRRFQCYRFLSQQVLRLLSCSLTQLSAVVRTIPAWF